MIDLLLLLMTIPIHQSQCGVIFLKLQAVALRPREIYGVNIIFLKE